MGFKFNPFTGTLDIVSSGTASGDVTGPAGATDNAIARYDGTTGKVIQDSKTIVQDGGAFEAQAFLIRRLITDTVTVNPDQIFITSDISIEDGELIIEGDAEVVII